MILLHDIFPRILTSRDLFIPIIVLGIIFFIAQKNRKKYRFTTAKKYFYPALFLRLMGCFLSALMYQYYYDEGDTFGYYKGATTILDVLWTDLPLFLEILWSGTEDLSFAASNLFRESKTAWYTTNSSTFIILKIGSLLALVTFKSYLSIGLILTYFSFVGCWKLFEVFRDLYPQLEKQIAIATLFIPSIFFWGSGGLMKDTIVMACLGYFVWSVYYLFIKGKYIFKSFIFMSISFYLVFIIKLYVAAALAPAVMVWVFLVYESRIKHKFLKILAKPFFILVAGVIAVIAVDTIASYSERLALDNVATYAKEVQDYHKKISRHGSGYELGEYEMTPQGMLRMAPKSINVALFRPYFWETRKLLLFPSALESLVTLLFTIFVFLKVGIWKTLKVLFKDPNILFCLIFALTFSFAVGFSTYNFGALARYKIPALPFYFIALFVLLDSKKTKKFSRIKNLNPGLTA